MKLFSRANKMPLYQKEFFLSLAEHLSKGADAISTIDPSGKNENVACTKILLRQIALAISDTLLDQEKK